VRPDAPEGTAAGTLATRNASNGSDEVSGVLRIGFYQPWGAVMRVANLNVNVPAFILCALAVSGCATTGNTSFADRMSIRMQCREQAGPEPFAPAGLFGAVGGIVKVSQPEWQAWSGKVEDCVQRRVAALEGTSGAKGKQSAKQ